MAGTADTPRRAAAAAAGGGSGRSRTSPADDAWSDDARFRALAELAREVAHDTNNLLLATGGYAALALMDLPGDSPARDSVAQIEVATRAAAELAREMQLALARSGVAARGTGAAGAGADAGSAGLGSAGLGGAGTAVADVGDALADVERLLGVAAGPGTSVALARGPGGLPPVAVPPASVRRAALFLALSGSGAARGATSLRVGATATEGWVVLELRWAGPATAETSLDVSLDAALAEIAPYGGSVERADAPESFTLRARLPALEPEAAARASDAGARETSASGEPGAGAAKPVVRRALVVDDEEAVGRVAARLLEANGWSADVSPDGDEALERFAPDPDRYAVALLDLSMPGIRGTELIRSLRQIRPTVGIVLMSGYASADVIDDLDAQAVVFLQKPFSRASLAEALDAAVQIAGGPAKD